MAFGQGLTVGTLVAELKLDAKQFEAGLVAEEAAFGKFAALLKVGALAGVAFLGLVGFESGKMAMDFQKSMELIRTQAGATQDEVDQMSAAILKLAPEVGTSPELLAAALYHIESAGHRGSDALDILKTAAEGAKVGNSDLEATTNALIATVNSGIGGVSNMSDAMGVLNSIVGAGNMRMDDLAAAMSSGILSTAKTFGVSIQSVGAALADMTRQGIPAEDAATRLRMTMSLLAAPSTKAQGILASIGLTQSSLADAMRGPGGILAAVQLLKTHLDDSGMSATQQAQAISAAFGGGRSSSAIMALLGSLDQFKTVQDQVNANTGTFADAWAATQQTASEKFDSMQAGFSAMFTSIGMKLLPAMGGLFDWVTANMPTIQAIFENVFDAIGKAADWFAKNVWPPVQTAFQWLIDNVGPVLNKAIDYLANTLLPGLQKAFDDGLKAIKPLTDFLASHPDVTLGLLALVVSTVVVPAFLTWAAAVLAAMGPLTILLILIAVAIIAAGQIADAWDAGKTKSNDWAAAVRDANKAIAEGKKPVDVQHQVITDFLTMLQTRGIFGLVEFAGATTGLADAFSRSGSWIQDSITSMASALLGFQITSTTVEGAIGETVNGIVTKLANGLAGIISTAQHAFSSIGNAIIDTINNVISIIDRLQIHMPRLMAGDFQISPGFDWNGLQIPQLPRLAVGTANWPGGYAMLGEKGPEVAYLPPHTQVWPTGTGPQGSPTITFNIYDATDPEKVGNVVLDKMQRVYGQARAMRLDQSMRAAR